MEGGAWNNYRYKRKMSSLKKLTCKWTLWQAFICLMPPLLGFCLGWSSNSVGSESGQIQSVKLQQNMVSNRTEHPPSHTLSAHTVLWHKAGWRIEPERRLEGQQFTKLGRKYIRHLTVSPLSSLQTLINTCRKVPLQINFFRWRHVVLVSI